MFDTLTPLSSNDTQVRIGISRKVEREQTDRVILNLSDSGVNLEALRDRLYRIPIEGLREIIIIRCVSNCTPGDSSAIYEFVDHWIFSG